MNGGKAIYFDFEKYFSLREASKIAGYHRDYLGQLCRSEQVVCRQVGNQWFVQEKSLIKYQSRESDNGKKKEILKNRIPEIKKQEWIPAFQKVLAVFRTNERKDEWERALFGGIQNAKYRIQGTKYKLPSFKFISGVAVLLIVGFLVFQNPQGAFAKFSDAQKIIKRAAIIAIRAADDARENIKSGLGRTISTIENLKDFAALVAEIKPEQDLASKAVKIFQKANKSVEKFIFSFLNINLGIQGGISSFFQDIGEGAKNISFRTRSELSGVFSFFQDIGEGAKTIGGGIKDAFVGLPVKISEIFRTGEEIKTEDKKTETIKPTVRVAEQTVKQDELADIRREIEILKTFGLKVEKIIERPTVVERTIQQFVLEVTKQDLETQLNQVNNKILSQYAELKNLIAERTQANFNAIALSQRINTLSNVAISSPTITSPTISNASSISGNTLSISQTASVSGATTLSADLNVDGGTLYVDSSNNRVGVGTTSPQYALDVDGVLRATSFIAAGQTIDGNLTVTGNIGVGTTSPWAKLAVNPVAGDTNQFVVGSSTATSFVITPAGRVGIGTASPNAKFVINDTGASAANLNVGRAFATDLGNGYYSFFSVGKTTGAANNFSIGFTENAADADTYGFLSVAGDDPTAGAGLIVRKGGNIGVGTTSPEEAIELALGKNIRLSDNTQIQLGSTVTDNSSITSRLSLQRLETTGTFPGRGPGGAAATGLYLQIPQPNSRVMGLMIGPEPSPVGRITEEAPFALLVNGDALMGDIFSIGSLPISAFVRQTTQTSVVGTVLMSNTSTITDGTGGASITLDSDANPAGVNNNAGALFLTAFGRGTGANANSIVFQTRSGASAATQRAVLDGNGNLALGIGAVDSARFHAYNNASTTLNIGEFEAAVGGYTGTSLIASNTLGSSSTYNLFSAITDSDGDAGGPNTLFLIRGDGNIGVGTTSPYAKLSVVGQVVGAYFTATTSTASLLPYASSTAITVSGTASSTNLIVSNATTLSNLTASRLLSLDSSKNIAAVANLASWVAGTSNQITVTDDADGTITLSLPQSIATASAPQFARLGLGGAAHATDILTITSTDTTADSKALNIAHSGAITGTGYGLYVSKTGASTTNVGGYFSASGATNNYGLIVENGLVGIGTTSPWAKLAVNPIAGDANQFVVGSSTAASFVIDPAGRVGIGTTSPSAKFVINDTGASAANLNIGRAFATDLGNGYYSFFSVGRTTGAANNASIGFTENAVDADTYGFISVAGDDPTAGTGLIVRKGGNIGVGTTSPYAKLSVEGSSALGNSALAGYFTATTSTASLLPYASSTAITVSGTASTTNMIVAGNATLSNLTASRLLSLDSSKNIASVANLASWVAGTSNQITVTDDADGTITLSLPQSIHTAATPQFAGIELGHATDTTLVRSGAGDLTIEGNTIYRVGGTDVSLADGGTNASLTASNGGIFYSTASAGAILAGTATAGQILRSGSSAAPAWSTATYPAVATGAGTVLRADGTNWLASTLTIPDTAAISTILYASAANVISALATANSGVLVTGATGIPFIATDIPTAVTIGTAYIYRAGGTDVAIADGGTGVGSWTNGQLLIGNTTGNTAALGTLTGTANQITVTNGASSITLSLPQSIATASAPQFARLGLGGAAHATDILTITSIDTTADSKALNIAHSGAITGTGYGLYVSKTGASTTNVGGYFSASGATNNYGLIVENGLVGVGTTTPWAKLAVNPIAGDANQFVVGSSTATSFVITPAGNVGIGTTSPTSKLEIYRPSDGSIAIRLSRLDESSKWGIYRYGSAGSDRFNIGVIGVNEPFTITTAGNVGIGTTSPAALLSIAGNTYLTGGLGVGLVNTSANTVNLATGGSYQIAGTSVLNATTLGSGVTGSSLTSVGTLSSLTVSGDLTIDTDTLYANSTSNIVGIGTTSPWAKLAVNPIAGDANQFAVGSSTATSFVITPAGKVGIGTSNPSDASALKVVGKGSPMIIFQETTNPAGGQSVFRLRNINETDVVILDNTGVGQFNNYIIWGNLSAAAYGQLDTINQLGAGKIGLSAQGSLADISIILTPKGAGSVGIGTTTPSNLFSAHGAGYISGNLFVGGTLTATSSAVLSGGLTLTCTGCLTDANVVDTITLTNLTQITNRAISDTTGTLTVARGGTGLTTFGGTNTLLYTTAADALSSIATANSGVLVTSGTGVPSISSTLPAVTLGGAVTGNSQNLTGLNQLTVTGTAATSTFSTGGLTIGTSQFVVQQTSGNVGIGTAGPNHKFEVSGGDIALSHPGDVNNSRYIGQEGSGNLFGANQGSAGMEIENINSPAPDSQLHFWTQKQGAFAGRAMTIDTIGNVGVGTTTPSSASRLHVLNESATAGDVSIIATRQTAGYGAISAAVKGDAFARLYIDSNGALAWSSGAATQDTNLYRSAADTLFTDDKFGIATLGTTDTATHLCRNTTNLVAGCSADYPEWYPGDGNIQAAEIVSISDTPNPTEDETAKYLMKRSEQSYDKKLLGVVGDPAKGGSGERKNENYMPLVLIGRVPIKVSLEAGPIAIGDRITSSSLPGVGMKATSSGMAVGIALESLTSESQYESGKNYGKILVFANLGYHKIDESVINGQMFVIDQSTGRIKASYGLDLSGNDLVNVLKIISSSGLWSIDENGKLAVQEIETQKLKVKSPSGFTIYDEDTNQPVCVKSKSGALAVVSGECGSVPANPPAENPPPSPPADTEPPVIAIHGNNPAEIALGTSYGDLGASAQDNIDGDISLLIKTFVNGLEMNPVQIDASTSTIHVIDYAVSDQAGNFATSTRQVIIY